MTYDSEYLHHYSPSVEEHRTPRTRVLVKKIDADPVFEVSEVWLVYLDGRFMQAFFEHASARNWARGMFEDIDEARS